MLTVLLAADDPKSLAEALEVLVPSAIDGLVRQVVVSVGPEPVLTILAEDAGAEIVSGEGSLGRRLAAAAALARSPWLLAPAGLPVDWRPRVEGHFNKGGPARFAGGLLDGFSARPRGLLVPRTAYDAAGGFRDVEAAEADLVKRLGRIARL
ncbi:MAG: hypothetical protein BGN86_13965 [Caulobacterales bacterium 68-7]|nr:hypothetical protein [Caulobacterales bacterium]OJU09245.1 MAG: hypothetical protein BGN86_13965 [Caulobacterales bacterium 68-7]